MILAAEAARRFRKNGSALLGLGIVGVLVAFSSLGPLVSGQDPDASDFSLSHDGFGAPPGHSSAHWFGTDALYRDVFTRLAVGGRVSLSIAAIATLLATIVGTSVGVLAGMTAGTRARIVDDLAMRAVDVLLALPFLLFVTAIGIAVGRADVGTIILVLGLTGWSGAARVVRARTMQVRELDYVLAARALGADTLRIIRVHVLPNVIDVVLIIASTSVAQMILAEAVLSYLTVGVPPPRATWGRMLHEGEGFLGVRFSLVAVPGFMILLSALGFTRLGDGLRDAIDPRAPIRRATLPVDLLVAIAAVLLLSVATPNAVSPPIAGASDASAMNPRRGGTLHVATFLNVRTLDPALAYDEGVLPIESLVFARLVDFDREGNLTPVLAREVHESIDGKTYTFILRDDVRLHDGSALDAAAVKRSIERSLHPKTPSPGASNYAGIVGFAPFHAGKAAHLDGVKIASDHAVEIDLDAPDAAFLALMTLDFMAPVCASMGESASPRSQVTPCGAGPFKVASFDPDSSVRLARHEAWFEPGKPYLDAIEWLVNVPPRTQRYKFEEGSLDYLRDLGSADVALYRAQRAWSETSRFVVKRSTTAIFLNTELAPFDNRAIRRAVAKAIDPSVLEKVRPDVEPADRVLPPSVPGPPRDTPMRVHDRAGALAEMRAAGFPFDPATKRGGYPKTIPYLVVGDTFEAQAAQVFKQQLAEIGIRIELQLATSASYFAEVGRRRAATMGWTGWNADFPDPSNFFEPILSSSAIAEEGSSNPAFYSNPVLDEKLAKARRSRDPEARSELYLECEEIVRDDAPWIPVYHGRALELWHGYVKGYAPDVALPQRFGDVFLAREGSSPPRLTLLDRGLF